MKTAKQQQGANDFGRAQNYDGIIFHDVARYVSRISDALKSERTQLTHQ